MGGGLLNIAKTLKLAKTGQKEEVKHRHLHFLAFSRQGPPPPPCQGARRRRARQLGVESFSRWWSRRSVERMRSRRQRPPPPRLRPPAPVRPRRARARAPRAPPRRRCASLRVLRGAHRLPRTRSRAAGCQVLAPSPCAFS